MQRRERDGQVGLRERVPEQRRDEQQRRRGPCVLVPCAPRVGQPVAIDNVLVRLVPRVAAHPL